MSVSTAPFLLLKFHFDADEGVISVTISTMTDSGDADTFQVLSSCHSECNDGRNTELTKRRTCLISTRQRARYILQVVTCDVYSKIIS